MNKVRPAIYNHLCETNLQCILAYKGIGKAAHHDTTINMLK